MSERTFTVKKEGKAWTVSYNINDPGTPNLDALGVLMQTTPGNVILIWTKRGKIAAVQDKAERQEKEKKARGGRQGRNKFF